MQLIDTHAHVCFDAYDEDREEMLQRAYDQGVFKLVHPCCQVNEIPTLLDLTAKYDGNEKINLFTALGTHPCMIEAWDDYSESNIRNTLEQHYNDESPYKIRAIGETGLDYFHATNPETHKLQEKIFRCQINIAKEHRLPIIVHTRDAWEDTLKILQDEYPEDSEGRSGVIHCYTGDASFAEAVIKHGFYISWSGIVTFKKNDNFREVAAKIPIERTLIETDSPYLAPQAQRGKRNEPSFVNYVAETLAECYGISKEELVKVTTANAEKLFKI